MRAVLQLVSRAKVDVVGKTVGSIGNGLLVLLGVSKEDGEEEIKFLVNKIINLRIFEDQDGKMNLSLKDVNGELLVVSQFTLYADCKRGRRPGFEQAARPEIAKEIYNKFVDECKDNGLNVATGQFQTTMDVELCNSGPVTIILDTNDLMKN